MDTHKTKCATYGIIHDGCDDVVVTLHGTCNDAPWKITRRMKRGSHQLTYEQQCDDTTWTNNTRTTLKLTQQDINAQLFNLAPSSTPGKRLHTFLLDTIIWNQHTSPGLMQASNADIKSCFSELTQASQWDALSSAMKMTQKNWSAKRQDLDKQLVGMRSRCLELRRCLAMERDSAKQWDLDKHARRCQLEKDLSIHRDASARAKDVLLDIVIPCDVSEKVQTLTMALGEMKFKYNAAASTVVRLQNTCKPSDASPGDMHARMETCKKQIQIQHSACVTHRTTLDILQCKLNAMTKDYAAWQTRTATPKCAACLQDISSCNRDFHDAQFKQQLVDLQGKMKEEHARLAKAEEEKNSLSERLADMKCRLAKAALWEDYSTACVKKADLDVKMKPLKESIAALKKKAQERLHYMKKQQQMKHRMDMADLSIENVQRQIHSLERSVNIHAQQITTLEERLTATQQDMDKHTTSMADMTHKEVIYGHLHKLFGKDGLPTALATSLIDELNTATSDIFQDMHPHKTLTIGYDMKGRLHKSIRSKTAGPIPLHLLSGGELRRLRLSGFLAFSELLLARKRVSMNIRIYDEPTQGMDNCGMAAFFTRISKSTVLSQYIISHRNYQTEFAFDRVLRIYHDNGSSRLQSCV